MGFFMLIGAFLGAAVGPRLADAFNIDKPKNPVLPTPAQIPQNSESPNQEPMVAVAKRVRASVVNIKTKSSPETPGNFFMNNPEQVQGIGSGVVIRRDGYIITNWHVVENADEIMVTLDNGQEHKAKVIGSDSESDIAILKIAKKNLQAAAVARSESLQVGSSVMAVGSPWELEHTVTVGIVSALGRNINVDVEGGRKKFYPNLIQTDAAINPGNSGGALSDRAGNVVGINTLIYSKSGGYEGVGFAIPIEKAIDTANQLIARKKVIKPFIGVLGQDIPENMASEFNTNKGALLVGIVPDGPADSAGLQKGDIIITIGGKKVDNMDAMTAIIKERNIGERLGVDYLRHNKKLATEIIIRPKPDKNIDKTRTRTKNKKGS